MLKKKYPIKREFFPFSHFTPPITEKFLKMAVPNMKVPVSFYKTKDCTIRTELIESFDGEKIETFVIIPHNLPDPAPCLFYIHGGGFVLEAAGYHYKNAVRYALEAACIVVFPRYRLAPEYPFPIFYEDCYSVFSYIYDYADLFDIDVNRIGVGGDSAGSAIAVGLCMMAIDRKHPVRFKLQMLQYPYLDARNNSESCQRYTDTPMWNSVLSARITAMTRVDKSSPAYVYYSPVEAGTLENLPPAYIETAEYDCLHDDGILYAKRLKKAGIPVKLIRTKGTMHGFDIMQRAPTTKAVMKKRIEYLKMNL